MLRKFDWKAFRPEGWGKWHFQQSVTKFYWDENEAHSGKRSIAVGRNQIAGCFQQYVPVTSGHRYRFSFWVKQRTSGDATVTVRWVNKKGWRDQGPNRAPRVRVPVAAGPKGWRRFVCSFSAPGDVTHAVVLLTAPRQREGEMTWFDDVKLEGILE